MSVIRKAEQRKELEKKQEDISQQELEKLRIAANNIFNTPDGRLFAKAFMRLSGIYKQNKNNNNLYEIGKERGKEELYLLLFKGLLADDIIIEIEKKEK